MFEIISLQTEGSCYGSYRYRLFRAMDAGRDYDRKHARFRGITDILSRTYEPALQHTIFQGECHV